MAAGLDLFAHGGDARARRLRVRCEATQFEDLFKTASAGGAKMTTPDLGGRPAGGPETPSTPFIPA